MRNIRRFTLIALSLALAFPAFSQITVTDADMPQSGDVAGFRTVSPVGITGYQDAGPNTTWNYANLQPVGTDVVEYVPATDVSIIYGAFFGFDSYGTLLVDSIGFGTFQFTEIYDFFRNTSSEFKAEGRGMRYNGIPIPATFQDEDEIYQFPLDYGDVDVSTFKIDFDLGNGLSFKQSGTRTNDVEGWGTLVLPNGTYNCLKVKTTILESDTIQTPQIPFPLGFTFTRTEYKWLAAGEKAPVLQVDEGGFGPGGGGVSRVRYLDNTVSGTWNDLDRSVLEVFPNPATQWVRVRVKGAGMPAFDSMLNVHGKRVRTLDWRLMDGMMVAEIDLSNLPAGAYFIGPEKLIIQPD